MIFGTSKAKFWKFSLRHICPAWKAVACFYEPAAGEGLQVPATKDPKNRNIPLRVCSVVRPCLVCHRRNTRVELRQDLVFAALDPTVVSWWNADSPPNCCPSVLNLRTAACRWAMRDFKDLTWLHILPKKWAETNESRARAIEEAHPVWWLSWCFKTGPCSQLANCGPESSKMVLGSSESPELTWFTGYLQQRSFCRAQKWLYDDPKIAGEHEPLQAGSEYICTCFMWICDRISPNDSLHIIRRWVLLFLQLASESNHVFKAVNMLDTSGRGWFPPWQLMMWQLGVMWELQSPFPISRGCRQLLLVKFWVWEDAASLLWMCGEVLAACEAESTRSSASQAVTRQDKKPRRAPSGVFTIVQKVCHLLPKDPKIFVAQKCAHPCRHDGRNTKDSIHEVCCGRKMIPFDAQLVQHTEVHPNERVVQAQNRALHHVFKNQTLWKPNYVIPIPTTVPTFRFRSLIVWRSVLWSISIRLCLKYWKKWNITYVYKTVKTYTLKDRT